MTAIFWKHGASGAWSNGAEWSDAANPGAAGAAAFATPLLSAGLPEALASAGPLVTTDSWAGAVSGDWSTAADWTAGVPTASTAATIGASGTYTVTVTSADAANSLTLSDAGATLADTGTLTIGKTLSIMAGSLTLGATNTRFGEIINTAATITVGTASSFDLTNNGYISGGTIIDAAGGLASTGGEMSGVTYDGTLNLSAANASLYLGDGTFKGANGTGADSNEAGHPFQSDRGHRSNLMAAT